MKHGKLKSIQHANRRSLLDPNKSVNLNSGQFQIKKKDPRGSQTQAIKRAVEDMNQGSSWWVPVNGDMSSGYKVSSRRMHGSMRRAGLGTINRKRNRKRVVRALRRARDKYIHEQHLADERKAFFGG